MVTRTISIQLLDPLNRLYRERLAQSVANSLKNTVLTPNIVTVIHTLVGVFGAYLIYEQKYILAVLCLELRSLLDCVDGILARMKNQSTAMGRTLDSIGDGVAFNSLMIAGAARLLSEFNAYSRPLIIVGVLAFAFVAVHSGVVYHLMRRKLLSIASKEVDALEVEWREHYEQTRGKHPLLLARIGFFIDSFTMKFVSDEWYGKVFRRRNLSNWKEKAIEEAELMNELACKTRKKEFQQAVHAASYVSDDNVFSLMSLCFIIFGFFHEFMFPFVHPVLIAFSVGFVYALTSLMFGLHYYHRFLHGVYRE